MKVLITGATGLIGSQIVKDCIKSNISVNFLTTSKKKITESEMVNGFYWNPKNKIIDLDCFKGVDSIIALSGSSISKLWTKANKRKIINSRVETLEFLKESINKNNIPIGRLVSASGVSLYPNSLEKEFSENETNSDDSFLAEVINRWENAAKSFKTIGVDVAIIRIGLVLSLESGVLKETIKPMNFGFGVIFGSGNQYQSWIHIEDISKLFIFVLEKKLKGIYNGVSPNFIKNSEFTKIISSMHSKAIFNIKIPRIFFSIIFGEMHVLLFESHKISSRKIQDEGFSFKFDNLKDAIENLIG
tara:strand:- start:5713 stop:6618 length:906 start_codon:yes stop_codon:yes gene_type:complete